MLTPGRNPFEVVLVAAALLAGVTSLLVPGAGSRIIVEVLPDYVMVWNVGLLVGASTTAVAMLLPQPWTVLIERVGMTWMAALFLPYGVAVMILGNSLSSTGALLILGYGLACAARAWQITYHRRVLRRAAQDAS